MTSISKCLPFVDEKFHLYHDLQMHVCDSISCIVNNISWMCLYVITKLGTNSIRPRSYLGSFYTMVRDHDHANAKSLQKHISRPSHKSSEIIYLWALVVKCNVKR